MNYKDKIEKIRRIKDLFINNYQEGFCKITKGESELHARVKAQVFHYLKCQDYQVWSEVNIKGNRRVDILAIHPSGLGIIVEICASESELKALQKEHKTPKELVFIKVIAKTFKYNTFKL